VLRGKDGCFRPDYSAERWRLVQVGSGECPDYDGGGGGGLRSAGAAAGEGEVIRSENTLLSARIII